MFLKSLILVLTVIFTFPIVSSAHVGGHGGVDEEDVISITNKHVATLIKDGIEIKGFGKLDRSWSMIPDAHKKINTKGDGYFIVSLVHPKDKKTLYLLLSSSGDLYDANFTGQFEGLNK